jgi:hypothetical protein
MNHFPISHVLKNGVQIVILLAMLLFSFGPGAGVAFAAPPPNDSFANAIVVTGLSFNHTVSTVEAANANEINQNLSCENLIAPGWKTVWYKYTSPTKGIVSANTDGTDPSFDSYIAVWRGTALNNLTFLTCDDETFEDLDAAVTFRTNPGVTYYIQVAQFQCNVIPACDPQPATGGLLQFHMDIGGGADTTGVFRPSNGALYLKHQNTTGFADIEINYGIASDYPVVGDWDGDGDATIGIYRNGAFYLRNSNTIGFADLVFAFGAVGDQPIAGDWDGDGDDTIGVYRSGAISFFLRNSNSTGAPQMVFALGNPGDIGIAGDWNGDALDTTGVFRPSNGALYLKNQNTTGFADIEINYGIAGDFPVVGDWDGNGTSTIGVYRNAQFFLRNSNTIGFADVVFALGIPGDIPIAGNWDGLP